jgi:hypothetical protein
LREPFGEKGLLKIVFISREISYTGRAVKRFDQRSRPEHANVQAQRARTLHLISVSTLKREVLMGREGTLEVRGRHPVRG